MRQVETGMLLVLVLFYVLSLVTQVVVAVETASPYPPMVRREGFAACSCFSEYSSAFSGMFTADVPAVPAAKRSENRNAFSFIFLLVFSLFLTRTKLKGAIRVDNTYFLVKKHEK